MNRKFEKVPEILWQFIFGGD